MPALKTFLVANMAAFTASAPKQASQQLEEQTEASGSCHVDSSTVPVSQVSIPTPSSNETNSPTPQEDEIQTAAHRPSSDKVITSTADPVVDEVDKPSQPPNLIVTKSSDVSVEPVEPSKDLIGTTSCEVTADCEAYSDTSTLTTDSFSVHSEDDVEKENCTENTTPNAPPTADPVVDEIVNPTHLPPNLNVTEPAEVPVEPVEPSKDLVDTATSCDVTDLEENTETSTLTADSPSIPSKDAAEENCTDETTPSTYQTNAPSEKQTINENIEPDFIPIEVIDLEADSPAPAVEADQSPIPVTERPCNEESNKIILSESQSGKAEMSNASPVDCIILDSDVEDSQISTGIPTPQLSPSSSVSSFKSSQDKSKRKAESDSDVEISEVLPPKRQRFSLRPCSVVLRTAFQVKIDQRDFFIGN